MSKQYPRGSVSTYGYCASCDRPAPLLDVGAFDFTLFCKECIDKYGARQLAQVANAALAVRQTPKKKRECLRCSAPLIQGSQPMCSACNQVYKETFGTMVKWS